VRALEVQLVVLVAIGLPCLGEQDQRRRVGGLGRERKVEQDERVRIPLEGDRQRVERDPDQDDDRLAEDVLRRAEEARGLLGAAPEGVLAESAMMLGRHASRLRSAPDGN